MALQGLLEDTYPPSKQEEELPENGRVATIGGLDFTDTWPLSENRALTCCEQSPRSGRQLTLPRWLRVAVSFRPTRAVLFVVSADQPPLWVRNPLPRDARHYANLIAKIQAAGLKVVVTVTRLETAFDSGVSEKRGALVKAAEWVKTMNLGCYETYTSACSYTICSNYNYYYDHCYYYYYYYYH